MVQDEVLKLLAYASVIPKYGIAVKSIQTLGRFMEGAEEAVLRPARRILTERLCGKYTLTCDTFLQTI